MRLSGLLPALALAVAVLVFAALNRAEAQDYDMDCKLILCMPAGFPSGCSDAFDHMIDRLRDGKSPIGFCATSKGVEYEAYEIDYEMKAPTMPQGWQCPEGKTLYHRTSSEEDGYWNQTVNTFCYDSAYQRMGWTSDGYGIVTTYTNKTPPERKDFWVNLTLEPDTPNEFSRGWQKFDTGRGSRTRVRYTD